jgi:hypothetical protein
MNENEREISSTNPYILNVYSGNKLGNIILEKPGDLLEDQTS